MKRKKLLCSFIIFGLCLIFMGTVSVYAKENKSLEDFLGFYLCDTPDMSEIGNPEVLELLMDDELGFIRYDELYYGTMGTTIRYEYTDYTINGNVLTCNYSRGYWPAYEDTSEDILPGTHEYTLEDDGTIHSDGHIYYRYEKENYPTEGSSVDQSEDEETHYNMLADAEETDFSAGEYSEDAAFWGIDGVTRKDIKQVIFCNLNTAEDKPAEVWDVSRDQDATVSAWFSGDKADGNLMIGAENRVIASMSSKSLFRCCTNLNRINFNGCFDTSNTTSLAYMFAECKNLQTIEGLENFDTGNVETMKGMFLNCEKLLEVNINDFNTNKILSISEMFAGCTSLEDINIDNFSLDYTCNVTDAFKDTVRDGDTPLLSRKENKGIYTEHLLDSDDILPDDTSLRIKVINCYDNQIQKRSSYADNLFYAVKDINGDKMPELITIQGNEEETYCRACEYDPKKNSIIDVEGINFKISGNVKYNDVYYLAAENQIIYKNDSEDYQVLQWKDGKFEEKTVIGNKQFIEKDAGETLDFRKTEPDNIWSGYVDVDSNGEDETVDAYAISNRDGYASIMFYVDNQKVFRKEITRNAIAADIDAYTTDTQGALIYLRMYSEDSEDYCGILQFRSENYKELLNMDDLINDMQLLPEYSHSYFTTGISEEGKLLLTFNLCSISYGKGFSFAIPYTYADDQLKQAKYITDIEEISSENYTLIQDKKIYSKIGSKRVAYTAQKGETLTPEKIWLSNGIIWIRVKNEVGKSGWVPMGAESSYLELHYAYASSVEEKVKENKESQIFFNNLETPDEDILYDLGEKSFSEEEYEEAVVYYSMIEPLKHNYLNARKKAKTAKKKIEGADIEESEKIENEDTEKEEKNEESKKHIDEKQIETAEKELLDQVKNTNFNEKYPLAYCEIDLDSDGVKEIIVRSYETNGAEGGIYYYDVYQYDEQKKTYVHLPDSIFTSFALDDAVRFWKEKGYILTDHSMGAADFYVLSFQEGEIGEEYDTSCDLSSFPDIKFKELSFSKIKEYEIYKQYLKSEQYLTDIKGQINIKGKVYDLDGDGINELILKGVDSENKYHYTIYTCKADQLQLLGSIENWQNGGNGEIYSLGNGKIVVNTRLADRQTYWVYSVKDAMKQGYSVSRQSLDEKDAQGNYKRVYEYSTADLAGNIIDGEITTDDQWNQFEESFTEVETFCIPWMRDDVVPNNSQDDITENSDMTDVAKIASDVKAMSYMQSNTKTLSMRWDSSGKYYLDKGADSEILAAYANDFDGDDEAEIFCVSYEPSNIMEEGESLRYSILKKNKKEWQIIAEQEILHQGYTGEYSDISCPNSAVVESEASVFFRKINGIYQFFYEEYRVGAIATGVEWYFTGFEFKDGKFDTMDGSNIYYIGSEDDPGTYLEKFCTLGFIKADIGIGQMTVDYNSPVYEILRMNKNSTKPSEEIFQWIQQGNSQESLECFEFTPEDRSADISKDIQEFQMPDTTAEESEYILPNAADRYLSEAELSGLTQEQIQLAINEIFARHGRCFTTEKMDTYFRSKSWYRPDPSKTDDQIIAEFNEYEKANEELLEKLRVAS